MTEAEELEMLRLRKRKTLAGGPKRENMPIPVVPEGVDPYRRVDDPMPAPERYAGRQANYGESAAAGALNDMTLGGADELIGAGETVVEQAGRAARSLGLAEPLPRVDYGSSSKSSILTKKVRGPDGKMRVVSREVRPGEPELMGEDPEKSFGENYRENRGGVRDYMRLAEEQNPKTFFGAGLAGSALTAPLLAGPAGISAKGMAAAGGAMGLLSSDADLTTGDPENYKEAAATTAFGAVAAPVLGKIGEQVPKIPGAVRALGKKIEGTKVGSRIAGSALAKRFQSATDAVSDKASEVAGRAASAVGDKVEEVGLALREKFGSKSPPVVEGVMTLAPGEKEAQALARRGGIVPGNPVPGAEGAAGASASAGTKGRRTYVPDIEDIDDEAVADFVNKHADKAESFVKKLGLDVPDAEGWFYRDVDLTPAQRHRMYKVGADERAAQEILGDPRYAQAKTLPQKKELVAARLDEQAQKKGRALAVFDQVAEPGELVDPSRVAARVEEELLAPLRRGSTGDRAAAKRVEDELQTLLERVPGEGYGMGLADTADYLQSLDRHLYKVQGDPTEVAFAKKALRRMRGIINNELEQRVDEVANRIGQPEAFVKWKDAKQSVGALAELLEPVEKRMTARESNRWMSLTDNIIGSGLGAGAGQAAGLFDDEPTAMESTGRTLAGMAAGGLANKWARERGPHVMAQRAWNKRMLQMLKKAPK